VAAAGNGQWALQADASREPLRFDALILACPPVEAARLLADLPCDPWLTQVRGLRHEAIATVYAFEAGTRLSQPMLTLHSSPHEPAQFAFDRGHLGGPAGLLALVISASKGDGADLGRQAIEQAKRQLALKRLEIVRTIVEKRATFACTPNLQRPGMRVLPRLLACGDYVDGPYPATLEGAVRSGLDAAHHLG
jgi:predicted NAD/FAD-dependent oxidoreductase